MEAVIDRAAVADLCQHFTAVSRFVPLRPIRNDQAYAQAVAALNGLLDAGAMNEAHPLADLAATMGELIGDYDDVKRPAQAVPARDMLRFLMEQHQLKQADLPELGSQGVISELLAGKRDLNLRQIRVLTQRFGVPAHVFLEDTERGEMR